jgi:shikimate dehydrogenase
MPREDMFDYFDPYAQITGELSSISKLDGRLEGHAKDPITAGLSLEAIIGRRLLWPHRRAYPVPGRGRLGRGHAAAPDQ